MKPLSLQKNSALKNQVLLSMAFLMPSLKDFKLKNKKPTGEAGLGTAFGRSSEVP
jgi:hypothetical protein